MLVKPFIQFGFDNGEGFGERLLAIVLFLTLFFPWPQYTAHAADEGRITILGTYKIPYFRNNALSTPNDNIRRAVIAIHGSGDDDAKAEVQYERMTTSACLVLDTTTGTWVNPPPGAACPRLDTTLIMAPHFMHDNNLSYYGLTSDGLYWGSGWKYGNKSQDTASYPRADRVSSFAVMDKIIEYIATSGNFPNLEKIVIAGHSAGGQFVNRYAAISPIEETIAGSGVDIKYIVANPSSYLYFANERVYPGTLDTFMEPHPFFSSLCPDPNCCPEDVPCPLMYDDYIYGLGNPGSFNGYLQDVVGAIGVEGIKSRYRNRSVVYLLGREDNDPCGPGLDLSCGARLEGRYRLERGLIYYHYIGHALGESVYDNHYLETIANAGHSSRRAWQFNVGRKHIFDTLGLAEYPEIIAPRGTVDFPDHTYKWYAVPGTSSYRISVTDTSGGGGSFTETVSPDDAGCAHGGLCIKRIPRAVSAGTWTVSARFLTTWLDSAPATFQVAAPGLTSIEKPSGIIGDHTPTFKWAAVAGAARYQIAVLNPTGVNYIRSYSELDAQCDCGTPTPTCVVTPDVTLNDGDYWWAVRAANAAGMGPWTPLEAFEIQTPASLATGSYTIKVRSSGKCLEYDQSGNVHLRSCRGTSRQQWALSGNMSVASLEAAGSSPAVCLEADNAGGADFINGGNVQGDQCVRTPTADDHQEWSIDLAQDGYYTLGVRSSGKCLDADNFASRDMRDCGNVQVWDCKDPDTRNTDNQEWRLEPVDTDEFRRPEKPATYPQPYITVNGEDRTASLRRGDSATIGFALANWNTIGPECDWWVLQASPSGLFFLTPSGWAAAARPIFQAPILDFPPPEVELPVATGSLPLGTYWLYFAVDMVPDGFLSWNHIYLDGIRVDLVP